MEEPKWKSMAKGVLFGILYCLVYLGLWRLSFNQWYLPAGIRVTGLLLLPYRYWPYLILGDAAALLVIRVPKAEKYSELWAYGTPFFIILVVAVVPWFLRKRYFDSMAFARWLPLLALGIATWTSAWLFVMNYYLGGPAHLVTTHNFVSYSVGDFLGIMMVALPAFLILHRKRFSTVSKRILQHSVASGIAILSLLLVATMLVEEDALRVLALLLMGLPATFLTLKHGWAGAAIGIVLVNLAVANALPEIDLPGQFDQNVFVVQQILCVLASILLVLGWRITENHKKALKAGLEKIEAHKLAKSSFGFNERHVRDQLHYLALLQLKVDENRNDLVEQLKKDRHFDAALAVNTNGVVQKKLFEQQASALYPQQIENGGLLAVLYSDAFEEFWTGDATLSLSFKGQPHDLPIDLQLNAYRCVCRAITVLSECAPSEYMIYLRTWKARAGSAILLRVSAVPTTPASPSIASSAAWEELEVRMKTHGGIVRRRHACTVSLWLPALSDQGSAAH